MQGVVITLHTASKLLQEEVPSLLLPGWQQQIAEPGGTRPLISKELYICWPQHSRPPNTSYRSRMSLAVVVLLLQQWHTADRQLPATSQVGGRPLTAAAILATVELTPAGGGRPWKEPPGSGGKPAHDGKTLPHSDTASATCHSCCHGVQR